MLTKIMDPQVSETLAAAGKFAGETRTVTAGKEKRGTSRPFPSPQDWRDYVLYFILLDRFNHPDKAPKARWNSSYPYRQGGTFKGVQAQLSYLAELGVNALWLSPVCKSAKPDEWKWAYAGYAPQNFLTVDERLGSEQDLIDLIQEAHALAMPVVLDITLTHTARVFDYEYKGRVLEEVCDPAVLTGGSESDLPVRWLNGLGYPRGDWRNTVADAEQFAADDGIYPQELRNPLFFRRRGAQVDDCPDPAGFIKGDMGNLRQLYLEYSAEAATPEIRQQFGDYPVLNLLSRCYQYLIAKYDIDGFGLGSFRYIRPDMLQRFTGAIREYTVSIGKKNFLLLGEPAERFASGNTRYSAKTDAPGLNAALDFPVYHILPAVAKGLLGVEALRQLCESRPQAPIDPFFIAFLDNHNARERFYHPQSKPEQITLGLTLLFTLPPVPCLYYGTEQALQGTCNYDGDPLLTSPESVREALWGREKAFDRQHALYREIKTLTALRHSQPPLRYGRWYFRQQSTNGIDFTHSAGFGGLVAFSRILGDREIVVVANTGLDTPFTGFVVLDTYVNRSFPTYSVLYSNKGATGSSTPQLATVCYWEEARLKTSRPDTRLFVELAPMEAQIIGAL